MHNENVKVERTDKVPSASAFAPATLSYLCCIQSHRISSFFLFYSSHTTPFLFILFLLTTLFFYFIRSIHSIVCCLSIRKMYLRVTLKLCTPFVFLCLKALTTKYLFSFLKKKKEKNIHWRK